MKRQRRTSNDDNDASANHNTVKPAIRTKNVNFAVIRGSCHKKYFLLHEGKCSVSFRIAAFRHGKQSHVDRWQPVWHAWSWFSVISDVIAASGPIFRPFFENQNSLIGSMYFVTLVTMELFSNTFYYFHHPLIRIIQFCHPRYVERRLVVVLLT